MKKSILFAFLLIGSCTVFAQPYKHAIGLKSGYPGFVAANYKFFIPTSSKRWALEFMGGTNFDRDNRYFSFSPMLEFNTPIGTASGYLWYVGLGPAAQYYTSGGYLYADGTQEPESFFLRSDLVLGIEFTGRNRRIPLSAAFDVGPSFNFIPVTRFFVAFNIGLRYTILD